MPIPTMHRCCWTSERPSRTRDRWIPQRRFWDKPSPRTPVIPAHNFTWGSCLRSWASPIEHAPRSRSSPLSRRVAMNARSALPSNISPRSTRRARLPILVGALFSAGIAAALPAQTQRAAYEELQTFSGVLNHIRLNYPDSVGYSELVAAAIRGVFRAPGPHSDYVARPEW